MKLGQIALIGVVVAILSLSFGYRQGMAAGEQQIAPAKVGVVDVTKVLQNSKKHKAWQDKMTKEEELAKAEFKEDKATLDKLQLQMENLKAGSKDYMDAMKEFLNKKSLLESKDKYYQEKVNVEMQQWTESLYTKMLEITKTVADKKGLDLVLAQEQLDLPAASLRDFMLSIRTKKVLYNKESLDITDEVLTALDEAK
jgi:Skp family chaperone for outer membrane proteins